MGVITKRIDHKVFSNFETNNYWNERFISVNVNSIHSSLLAHTRM